MTCDRRLLVLGHAWLSGQHYRTIRHRWKSTFRFLNSRKAGRACMLNRSARKGCSSISTTAWYTGTASVSCERAASSQDSLRCCRLGSPDEVKSTNLTRQWCQVSICLDLSCGKHTWSWSAHAVSNVVKRGTPYACGLPSCCLSLALKVLGGQSDAAESMAD